MNMSLNLKQIKIDWSLLIPTITLLIIGYIMIFSTTSLKGLSEFNDSYYFIKRHTIFVFVGVLLFFIALKIPIQKYKHYALTGYLLITFLLIITLIPGIGVKIGGAQRWINLGGIQFQPVEIAKFWWAVGLSMVLSKKSKQMGIWKTGTVPVLIILIIPIIGLMLQPDLGNSILMLMVGFALLILSNMPIFMLLLLSLTGLSLIGFSIITHPYQLQRVQSFLNPWNDTLGANYHIIQSFTAIGSGGVFGFGIGESRLKYFYLPLHYSDFIFAILCEEGGLFFAIIVLMAFAGLIFRGIQIANGFERHSFEHFLVLALTFFIGFQALINICVVTGLFPITGIPLTFISYGGTSILSSMFSLGVIYKLGVNQ